MAADLEDIYDRLYAYCEAEGFAGHDPFDGLNSVLFQLTPLKHVRLARLAWLQMIKRSPVDLRDPLRVPKGLNPKGLALFTLAEVSRSRVTGEGFHADNVRSPLERLLETKIAGETNDGLPTAAFGYNFDWQSRHFFAPKGTPAVVPTAFAGKALIEAREALGDDQYLVAADQICTFILTGLNRLIETDDEVCFSYTPLDRAIVYNASLLAGETLARVGSMTKNEEYLSTAAKAARFVIRRQREDGAWAYGAAANQQWVDNFHTAYVLMSLRTIAEAIPNSKFEISDSISCGLGYWRDNFFLDDGTPKYYDNSIYPIDIHSAAVAIVAFCQFGDLPMARRTAEWTIASMFAPEGYFYYQVRKGGIVKTPFIRWSQAWMAYAVATLIEAECRG
jgi:hypothetical protein